jgi:hypothetical protein
LYRRISTTAATVSSEHVTNVGLMASSTRTSGARLVAGPTVEDDRDACDDEGEQQVPRPRTQSS